MVTNKQCSEGLADLTMPDLKNLRKRTLRNLYLCHVGGVTTILVIMTLYIFNQLLLAAMLLPFILWLNQMRKDRSGEAKIIKGTGSFTPK